MKKLIVNADDCNLTPGVTRAILKSHDQGIVTSTTWMANLESDYEMIKQFLIRKELGIGIHLNITFNRPVSDPESVKSLLKEDGCFRKVNIQTQALPEPEHVAAEYENQIRRFEKIFGRLPTHLDTHHQIHDLPFFGQILTAIAQTFNLPVRRSKSILSDTVRSTDFLIEDLDPAHHWTSQKLLGALEKIQEGVSELMCHPGYPDEDLCRISSFTLGREAELEALCDPRCKECLKNNDVELINFGMIGK